MNISHNRVVLYFILIFAILFIYTSLVVMLNDIEQKEPEIKQLNSQSYHESSLILSLVSQLNSAELSQNNDRESPNPNITEFDNIPIAILKNNKADLLKTLGLLFDTDNGLALSPELEQLANIYGYQISGSADNPIISAK
ncbi:hypothetical protein AN213_03114 [Pseudoalteromonas sp. P1-8]|nr:hypothetical protein AN213_03114 [Pseudoalteromonas sp. P1-8]